MKDKCVMCGEVVPEGRHVCPKCAADHPANKTVPAMRDRLIELIGELERNPEITCPRHNINQSCEGCKYSIGKFLCDNIGRKVDYLLANGVLVSPCKVGDTVWFNTWKKNATVCIGIQPHTVDRIEVRIVCDTENLVETRVPMWEIGKSVFLTREAAEQALKGRQ